MSSALTYIVLGYANLFASQPVPITLPVAPGSIAGTLQGPFRLQTDFNYTQIPDIGAHTVSTRKTTWNTARRTCREQGGHLAIVNSVAEAEAIVQLFNKPNVLQGWIGVHDLFHEDEFVTIHDQPLSQTGFDVWRAGQPNNWNNIQHCVLLTSGGKLVDETCTNRYNFICEFPGDQLFVLSTSNEPGTTPEPDNESVSPGIA